ncbi:hypothetical protein FACS1894200_08480 [Spirochaetia bacterium]|nr:hypothetical protein FACS1894200_08480 [Spirochaetia bacterium]
MRIYLDNCCLNRPFDNQSQDKIKLESEAVLSIIQRCQILADWYFFSSDILEDEIEGNADPVKKLELLNLYEASSVHIEINDSIVARAKYFELFNIKKYDALHLASAEYADADVLLTTDKNFINHAKLIQINVKVINPVNWLMEVLDD